MRDTDVVQISTDSDRCGLGFLVKESIIVTAHHCLYGWSGNGYELQSTEYWTFNFAGNSLRLTNDQLDIFQFPSADIAVISIKGFGLRKSGCHIWQFSKDPVRITRYACSTIGFPKDQGKGAQLLIQKTDELHRVPYYRAGNPPFKDGKRMRPDYENEIVAIALHASRLTHQEPRGYSGAPIEQGNLVIGVFSTFGVTEDEQGNVIPGAVDGMVYAGPITREVLECVEALGRDDVRIINNASELIGATIERVFITGVLSEEYLGDTVTCDCKDDVDDDDPALPMIIKMAFGDMRPELLRSASLASTIAHPGIPTILRMGEGELELGDGSKRSVSYVIMRRFDGVNLNDLMRSEEWSKYSKHSRLEICRRLVGLYKCVSQKKLWHRTLHLRNILVRQDELGCIDVAATNLISIQPADGRDAEGTESLLQAIEEILELGVATNEIATYELLEGVIRRAQRPSSRNLIIAAVMAFFAALAALMLGIWLGRGAGNPDEGMVRKVIGADAKAEGKAEATEKAKVEATEDAKAEGAEDAKTEVTNSAEAELGADVKTPERKYKPDCKMLASQCDLSCEDVPEKWLDCKQCPAIASGCPETDCANDCQVSEKRDKCVACPQTDCANNCQVSGKRDKCVATDKIAFSELENNCKTDCDQCRPKGDECEQK